MFVKSQIRIITLLLWLALHRNVSNAIYPPLVVLYNLPEDFYASIDAETFNQYRPKYTKIISGCPIKKRKGNEFHLVSPTIYVNFVTLDPMNCDRPYKPSMTTTSIGYYLEAELLKEYIFRLPPTLPNAPLDTFFLSIYEIDTNKETFHTTRTQHRIASYEYFVAATRTETCQTFFDEIKTVFVENKEIAPYYDKNRQKKIRYNHYDETEYFVPAQLTPLEDFTDVASRKASCTYYNTVPLWFAVAKGPLKKLEIYIRHVADILQVNTLEVTTIAHGILQLPFGETHELTINDKKIVLPRENASGERKEVYLDPHNSRIPVPRILVKILHYRVLIPVPKNDEEKNQYDDYYMAFVIYNELDLERVERICETDVCEKYGWLASRSFSPRLRFFCCDVDDPKLKSVLNLNLDGKPLDLNLVPTELDKNGKIVESVTIPTLRELVKVWD